MPTLTMATVVGQSKDTATRYNENKQVADAFHKYFRAHFEVAAFFEEASHTLLPYLGALPVKPVELPTGVVSVAELCVAVHVLKSPQNAERVGLAITVWFDPASATTDAVAEGSNLDAARVAMAHLVCAAASGAFAPESAPYPGLFGDPPTRKQLDAAKNRKPTEEEERLEKEARAKARRGRKEEAAVLRQQKAQIKREARQDDIVETRRAGTDPLFEDIRTGKVGASGVRNNQKAIRRKRGALAMLPFDPNARIVDYPGVDGETVPPHAEIIFPRLEKTNGLELDVPDAPKRCSDAIEAQMKTILEAFGHEYLGSRKLASGHPDVARRRIGLRVGAKELLRDQILYDSEGTRLTAEEFKKSVTRELFALKLSL